MAERLGVTPPYVSGVESGQRNLTLGALAQIADALGTDLDIRFPEVTGEYERLDEELAARGIEVGRR